MAKGDHIVQEAYIRDMFGNDGFLIFYKERGKYKWRYSNNYCESLFMYKGKIKNLNPEKSGGSAVLLKEAESSVYEVTDVANFDPSVNWTPLKNLNLYNKMIDYGLSLVARYDAAYKIQKDLGVDAKFDDIFNSLKKNCHLYLAQETIDSIFKFANENNILFEVHQYDKETGNIVFPNKSVIISENCCAYYSGIVIYPIKSNTLYCCFQPSNEEYKKLFEKFSSDVSEWLNFICDRSQLFLLADKDFPEIFQKAIQELFESGHFNLIEVI
jgi:hypothetical protein